MGGGRALEQYSLDAVSRNRLVLGSNLRGDAETRRVRRGLTRESEVKVGAVTKEKGLFFIFFRIFIILFFGGVVRGGGGGAREFQIFPANQRLDSGSACLLRD